MTTVKTSVINRIHDFQKITASLLSFKIGLRDPKFYLKQAFSIIKCDGECQGQECEQLEFICEMSIQEEEGKTILYLTIAVIALTVFVIIGFFFLQRKLFMAQRSRVGSE